MQVASMGATTLSYKDFSADFLQSETDARIAVIEKENIELARLGKTLKNVPKRPNKPESIRHVQKHPKIFK